MRDSIIDALAFMGDLPTLPEMALRVSAVLDNPSSSPKDITEITAADPVLTARLLKLANSAYYQVPNGVTTVEQSLAYLGYNTLFQLLIKVSVLEFSRLGSSPGIEARALWQHALGVGLAAEVIGERMGYEPDGVLFTAGLLHDIGAIALANALPDRYNGAVDFALSEGVSIRAAERHEGLPSHDEVGAILAYEWRLPNTLRAVIECHHQTRPERSPGFSEAAHTHVDIVAAADAVCQHLAIGHPGARVSPPLDAPPIDRFGLIADELPGIKALIAAKANTSEVFAALLKDTL